MPRRIKAPTGDDWGNLGRPPRRKAQTPPYDLPQQRKEGPETEGETKNGAAKEQLSLEAVADETPRNHDKNSHRKGVAQEFNRTNDKPPHGPRGKRHLHIATQAIEHR